MPQTQKHEIKTDYILEKGMDVLWSKGYNGTSVNDIVHAAGVPKGSFYFYFKSKEDFTVKAINRYFDTMLVPGLEILGDTSKSAKQRLIGLYEYKIGMIRQSASCNVGCMANNIGSEMAEHSTAIRNTIAKKEEMLRGSLIKVVKEAQEDGEISNDLSAEALVRFAEDAGKGAMMSMKLTQSIEPLENMFNVIMKVLLK